ncbi:MAG: pectin methylesterase [Lachnospiraceae bacterium]|nr:pectin methylesterase [Lachnospiraceae bacterium]
MLQLQINVNPADNNSYSSIEEALKVALELRQKHGTNDTITINLAPGTYHERLTVNIHNLVIQGTSDNASDVTITHGDYAQAIHADGNKYGTFRTATFFIDADNVTLRNLTLENNAGAGVKIGQALALYADGDNLFFENCRLLGRQDTLFTAPLPPNELQKHGFRGPKEFAPRRNQAHYYKNCYIEGDVDFIFGSAAAYFENCELFSVYREELICGYVAAPSTPEGRKIGYIFNHCRFTSDCPSKKIYLGRPWRDYAKMIVMNSYIGEHIYSEGWHDWDKPHAHETIFFGEYNNYGPGADISHRAPFVHILTDDEAKSYDLSADDDTDKAYIFKCLA